MRCFIVMIVQKKKNGRKVGSKVLEDVKFVKKINYVMMYHLKICLKLTNREIEGDNERESLCNNSW